MDVLEYIKEKKGKRLPESFKAPKVYNILPYLGTDLITFDFSALDHPIDHRSFLVRKRSSYYAA